MVSVNRTSGDRPQGPRRQGSYRKQLKVGIFLEEEAWFDVLARPTTVFLVPMWNYVDGQYKKKY
jgi:hypothetical protein